MDRLYYYASRFKLFYRIQPFAWLLIMVGFLALWTLLMFGLDRRVSPELSVKPGELCRARRCGRVACMMNLILMLLGLAIIILVTFLRQGSSEHQVILIPLRVLFAQHVPRDYWHVSVMNIVLYVPFACGLVFCLKRSRGWSGQNPALATVLICLLLSITAETLQFFLGSGLAEVDDVLMNTLGAFLGTLPYRVCSLITCRS